MALDFAVSGGTGALNNTYLLWDRAVLTLSDNATNYVYIEDPDDDGNGNVTYSTTGFPNNVIELFVVETSNGDINTVVDQRSRLIKRSDTDAADLRIEKRDADIYATIATGISPDAPNGQQTTWLETTHKLATNATNYLYLEDPDADGNGDISINQSGYPSDTVSLWRIETDADSVLTESDDRPLNLTNEFGNTSNADLSFGDDIVVDDSALSMEPILGNEDLITLDDGGSTIEQNEQTTWTISPGVYDQSGNGYEDGSVVTKYE